MRFLKLAALALAIVGGTLGVTNGPASATPLTAGALPGIATENPLVQDVQYRRRYYRPYRAYRPVYRRYRPVYRPYRRVYRPYRAYRPVYRPYRRYYRPYRGYGGPAVRFRF